MSDKDGAWMKKEAAIDDWTFYTSRASRGVCAPIVNRHSSFLPTLSSPRHISLGTLDDIYKLRIRVQNVNMYMHMS